MAIWKSLHKLLMIEMTSSRIWLYFNTDSIKFWWTSPKVFCKSINVMVTERCLQRASFIMCDMLDICSKVPLKPGVNPFCIEVSIYLLLCKNLNNDVSLNNDVKIFNITGSNVIALTFEGSNLSPFIWITMVVARCQDSGIEPPYKF